MMRSSARYFAVLLAIGLPAEAVWAHALLDHAVPRVGGTLAAAPPEIRLSFSEGVEPRFSRITLSTADGQPINTAAAQVDPADHRQLVLPLPSLPAGTYRVSWRVVAADAHRTEGNFIFTVQPDRHG